MWLCAGGDALAAELRASMLRLKAFGDEVAALRGEVRDGQLLRLRARIAELMQDFAVREERVMEEAAMLAERGDIEEEVVRLRTHIDRFLAMLDEAANWEAIGFPAAGTESRGEYYAVEDRSAAGANG